MRKEKQIKKLKGTNIEDLRGMKFNLLTAIDLDFDKRKQDEDRLKNGEIKSVHWYWKCMCDCGGTTSVSQSNLKTNRTTSCGCESSRKFVEVGDRFGKLTIVSRNIEREQIEEKIKDRKVAKYWNLKCDCGNEKIIVANTSTLNIGGSLSCGCLIGDKVREHHKNRALNGNSIMHFLINKYGKEIALKMTDNEYNKSLNLYEINKGDSNNYIHINCLEKDYHGDYEVVPCHISDKNKPTGCPYCATGNGKLHPNDSLGAIYPETLEIWSEKNDKTPYEYAKGTDSIVWWKCKSGIHDDYERKVSDYVRAKYDCPHCALERTESMLQKKVRLYLSEELGYRLNHEWNCTIVPKNPKVKTGNNTMPFDNEVVDLKLIIEVHGEQHYKVYSFNSQWKDKTGLNPEQSLHKRKLYDRYKSYVAYKNGYNFLEIPYWTEDDESYKNLIDEKIKEIKKGK